MTCQVILEFSVKEDCMDNFQTWMREILPDTRGYDGCVSLSVTQNQDDVSAITIIEQWDSRQHYENYLQWRTDTGVLNDLLEMIDGEPSFRFFNYLGI